MPLLLVTDKSGAERSVDGNAGLSIMEVLRNGGFEIDAICGGACSCASCHIYVESSFIDRLPPMGDDEREMLESSEHARSESRLSCQLRLNDSLAGMRLTIAPSG